MDDLRQRHEQIQNINGLLQTRRTRLQTVRQLVQDYRGQLEQFRAMPPVQHTNIVRASIERVSEQILDVLQEQWELIAQINELTTQFNQLIVQFVPMLQERDAQQEAQRAQQEAQRAQQEARRVRQEAGMAQQQVALQLQQLRAAPPAPVAREARPAAPVVPVAREARPAAPVAPRPFSDYRCNLRKMQCTARKPNGIQCSRNTIKTIPYCWQHGISLYGLQVKPSVRVPGHLGIFATRDFAPDVVIIDHPYGELVSDRAIRRRYGDFDSPFVIPTNRVDKFWDDTCSRGLMGYVQDDIPDLMAYNPAGYNTEYQIGRNKNNIMLVTTKAIVAGDELTVDKGMDPDNVQYPRTLWREDRRLENRFLRDDRYDDTTFTRRLGRARRL